MFPNEIWTIILKKLYKSPNQCRLVCKDFNAIMCEFLYDDFGEIITTEERVDDETCRLKKFVVTF